MSPKLGMGCWQLAGSYRRNDRQAGWPPMQASEANQIVRHALDRGIRFFDTAAAYGDGESERRLGVALAGGPGDVRVCTKVVLPASAPELQERITGSLRRLGRPIDILLLHGPPDDLDWDRVDLSPIENAIQAGDVGAFGVSARSITGARNAASVGAWMQWVFHPLERRPAHTLFPERADGRFIARSPLSRGLFSRRSAVPSDFKDMRAHLPEPWMRWTIEHAQFLRDAGLDPAEMAIRLPLSFDAIGAVVPGLRTVAQIDHACDAEERGPLDDATLALVETLPDHYPPWSERT